MGLFAATAHVVNVAYQSDLVGQFSHDQTMFHASLLCRFFTGGDRVACLGPIEIKYT